MDSRKNYTKSKEILKTTFLTKNQKDFDALINPILIYAKESISGVPLSNRYETTDGKQAGFQVISVVEVYFMKVLEKKLSK